MDVCQEVLMEKLSGELAGNTMVDETQVNDQAFQQIMSFLKTEKMKQFRALQTPLERIQFIYKHEAYWPLLQSIRKSENSGPIEKDEHLSRHMREAGNNAYSQLDDELALKCYNEALLAAPADPWDGQGEDMSLALANRSALFSRQGNLKECLRDTTLALKSGYPKHLRYKLLQRQAKCLCEIGDFKDAKNYFSQAVNSLLTSRLNKDQKQIVQTELEAALEAIQIKEDLESALSTEEETDKTATVPKSEVTHVKPLMPPFEKNPKFPCLAKGLTIKYDSKRGRHCIATEDISCGSYVAYEKPVLSFLWSDNLLTHCTTCFTPVVNIIPCYTCCCVVFCSSECRTKAWSSFHPYECKALEGLTSVYQNIFPAYRAVAQKPLRFFQENKNKFMKYDIHRSADCYEYEYYSDSESGEAEYDSEEEDFTLDIPYRSQDYENFYNLLTHPDKASDADHLAFSTSACLLLYYLKIGNYFGSCGSRESDRELNESELLIARLLYHFLEILQVNTDEVCQAGKWNPEKGLSVDGVGCSVNLSSALFNHSCNPNTVRANIGTASLLMTTANIRKGQEVTVLYQGMHYQDKLQSTRQKWLQERYKFQCTCTACSRKWPQYEFMTKSTARPGVHVKDLQFIKRMYSTISKLTMADLTVGHYDRIKAMWSNYYNQLDLTLEQPNKGNVRLQNRLKDVLWLRWGSRGVTCQAPEPRDHKINQRRSSSNINIPTLGEQDDEDEER